ncbi:MAG: hypothetical protein FK734_05040 [Asgard group archaeon]|nr:hypothetical protein [Asgard group archaeon]
MIAKEKCTNCVKKKNLQWCFDCEKYYCIDCVELIESDEVYSNHVKYFVRCPVDYTHHMNSTWLGRDWDD